MNIERVLLFYYYIIFYFILFYRFWHVFKRLSIRSDSEAHGSYRAISGGEIGEALLDLTGCPTESIDFDEPSDMK